MHRARRTAVPPSVMASTNLDRIDYRDAFGLSTAAGHSAETWLRRALADAPSLERGAVVAIWRACGAVMTREPGYVLGCPVIVVDDELAYLDVTWRSGIRANVFACRTEDRAVVSSLVRFEHRGAHALWTVIAPLHRLASILLLTQANRRMS